MSTGPAEASLSDEVTTSQTDSCVFWYENLALGVPLAGAVTVAVLVPVALFWDRYFRNIGAGFFFLVVVGALVVYGLLFARFVENQATAVVSDGLVRLRFRHSQRSLRLADVSSVSYPSGRAGAVAAALTITLVDGTTIRIWPPLIRQCTHPTEPLGLDALRGIMEGCCGGGRRGRARWRWCRPRTATTGPASGMAEGGGRIGKRDAGGATLRCSPKTSVCAR